MPTESAPIDIVEVFCSYSHQDEEWRKKLETHLSVLCRQQLIALWSDRKIEPGTDWKGQIDEHLNTAEIILLLISADFVASNYCYDIEMKRALERYAKHEANVISISVRPVVWTGLPFAQLQALPKDAKPITTWANQDEAFVDVTQGIREIAIRLKQASKSPLTRGTVFRTDALVEPAEQWVLKLRIAMENLDAPKIKTVLDALRQWVGNAKLTLQKIDPRSTTLIFSSSRPVFERIRAQVESHQLTQLAGVQIERVEWQSGAPPGKIVR